MNRSLARWIALIWIAASVVASEAPEIPEEAPCVVCARNEAGHGVERVAAWREFEGSVYTFCSTGCAERFDAMPEGYAKPVLPRSAPELSLRAIDGEPVPIASAEGATLVDFWATWCAPCIELMPTLSRLHDERADQGFRVIGISIDEDPKQLQRFLSKRAPSYPVVHDAGEDPAWWAFRVPAIPASFLVDSEGRIVAQWTVDLTEEALQQALAAMEGPGGSD